MKLKSIKLLYNKYYPKNYGLIKDAKRISRRLGIDFSFMQYAGKTTLHASDDKTILEGYMGYNSIRDYLSGLEKAF